MGDGNKRTGNGTVDGDVAEVELEAMRKDDFSWHPCKVSLCSNGVGLMVEYSNDNSDGDDIILSTKEAVARLRIRSTPLEGVACSIIQERDCVLAKRNRVNLFFDAEVIKVLSTRHSKKTRCRCTFMVRWTHNGLEGETAIIPSSALMKVSAQSIHVHPAIFAFFNVLSTSSCCNVSPLRAVGEGTDCEMDINELEKQIEVISSSADALRMKVIEVLSEEVDAQEHSQGNPISAAEVCDMYCIVGSIGHAQCKLPVKMEVKLPPSPSSFTQEAFSGIRSPNPIAARASLASLMSKSCECTEILPAHKDVKGYLPPPNITSHPIAVRLLNGSSLRTISFSNNSSKVNDDYFLGKEVATATFVPKYENIVKELFPAKKPIKEPQTLDEPSEVWKSGSKTEKSCEEVAFCVGNSVSLTTKNKGLSTRSNSAVKRSSCKNVEKPLHSARRMTRSVVREINEKQTVETDNVNREMLVTTTEQKFRVQKRDLLHHKEITASFVDNESSLTISDKFKNQLDKKGVCENIVSEMRNTGWEMQTLNNSRRLTRSAVIGKTKRNNGDPHKGLEDCSFPENTKSDLEVNITSESRAVSWSPVHGICPNPTAEGYEKEPFSASIKTAEEHEDKDTSNLRGSQGVKRKSITCKKQEVRFSPRLRFLPRLSPDTFVNRFSS